MKLVRQCSEEQIKVGDRVVDFRGEVAVVTNWREPHKPASTGRVYRRPEKAPEGIGSEQSYFPEVYGLQFVKEAP